jgi:polar amino acid transport system substrate-binding protein
MLKIVTVPKGIGDISMFKGKAVVLLVAIAALILLAGCVSAPSEEKKVAVFSGHPDWFPNMGTDKNGIDNVGRGPNVTKLAFEPIGVTVYSKNLGSWEEVQELAKSGKIDGLVGAYITKEREKYYVFSIAYAFDNVTAFSLEEKGLVIDKKEDLLGKKGIATIGDSYGQTMDDYIVQANLTMLRASSPEQAFILLKEGKGDYVIYSSDAGRNLIKKSGLSGITESEPIARQSFHIAISRESKYVKDVDKIDLAIKDMIEKGTLPKE